MELEVGMYVRADGSIGQICGIEEVRGSLIIYQAKFRQVLDFVSEKTITKASHDIIDLIEEGDYVNGWRVNKVEKKEDGTLLTIGRITSFVSRNEKEPYLTQDYKDAEKMCKLKSIVTKEQFERMECRIGE